nr:hypothetical protein BaRGS_001420 [Batillaria attramentaria]
MSQVPPSPVLNSAREIHLKLEVARALRTVHVIFTGLSPGLKSIAFRHVTATDCKPEQDFCGKRSDQAEPKCHPSSNYNICLAKISAT